MSNFVLSKIRTLVPMGMGLVLTWLAQKAGVVIDEQTASQGIAFFVTLASGLWYALWHTLEQRYPQFGWLLGYASLPYYGEGGPVAD